MQVTETILIYVLVRIKILVQLIINELSNNLDTTGRTEICL